MGTRHRSGTKSTGSAMMKWALPVLAGVLAIGSAGCGSTTTQSQGGSSASSPAKTGNLNDLSNAMLLQESDYPSVPGGYFETVSVHEQPAAGPSSRECAATSLIREGGQTAASILTGDRIAYTVELFYTGSTPDVHQWANKCLPYDDHSEARHGGDTMKAADLPGLPTSAVGIEASIFDDAQRMYLAWGVVRGILVRARGGGAPADVQGSDVASDVVKLFNRQADLLNSY